MKKIILICLSISFFLLNNIAAQTSNKEWTKHDVKKWFNKKEWLGGLSLQPHATLNKQEFARQYESNKNYWNKAFAFLKEHDLKTLPPGRETIDSDNVFAIITENPTKDYDSTKWESHHNYIDIHYVISGTEKIGVYPVTKLSVTTPYNEQKDIMNYSGEGKLYDAMPGVFFIFFPNDAHRPNITTGGNQPDKKIVIKIRYSN